MTVVMMHATRRASHIFFSHQSYECWRYNDPN